MKSRRVFLIIFILSTIVAGCVTNSVPAINLYTIDVSCEVATPSEKNTKISKVLKVSKPKSTAAIMSRHILYQENEFEQYPYAHSKWSDTPNKMLTNLFISCISKNSVFKSVLPSHSKGRADLLLESTLLAFHHHINPDGSSDGRVRIEFYLIDSVSGEVVAAKEFVYKASAKTFDVNGGVSALNDASISVALSLSQWLSSLGHLY
ncbi:MAG: hypothetical protein COA54_03205 [Thiotrichaceae bacterium]|nr:MAG: hypothetical protein COA54_03205 [Thiotrichaceae bacterium]